MQFHDEQQTQHEDVIYKAYVFTAGAKGKERETATGRYSILGSEYVGVAEARQIYFRRVGGDVTKERWKSWL